MTTPEHPENIPAHLVAEADQLTAMQEEFGESSLGLVIVALAQAVLESDAG